MRNLGVNGYSLALRRKAIESFEFARIPGASGLAVGAIVKGIEWTQNVTAAADRQTETVKVQRAYPTETNATQVRYQQIEQAHPSADYNMPAVFLSLGMFAVVAFAQIRILKYYS